MFKQLTRGFFVTAMLLCATCNAANGLESEVKRYKGRPQLFVNGKLASSLIAFSLNAKDFQDFVDAGIFVVDMSVPFPWVGPDKYDFKATDDVFDQFIQQDKRVMFLPRFNADPGEWWCKEFPEEITKHPDGTPAGTFGDPCRPSFASAKYRQMAARALQALVAHLEARYGDRIIGYFPGNGIFGEWFSWNAYWQIEPGAPPPTRFGVEDYSQPAQAAFRLWLRQKYHGSVAGLRQSWGEASVTFETAGAPSEEARKRPQHGIFFDPAVSTQVPDYFEFYNALISDVLLEQCRAVKEATHRKKVVGAFYGYLWSNWPHLSQNHAGHLGLGKVLDSPDVDFIAAPYTYDNRAVGGPDNSQTLPESVALHGKLYFNEVDTETHLHQRQWRWADSLRNPKNFEETKGLLIRDFGYAFTKGTAMWYMDLLGGMFHDPGIIKLFSDVRKVDEKYLATDKRTAADVAVILDEDSFRYFADGEVLFTALLSAQKQWELGYLGAPFDCYRLRDLTETTLRDYKLYIFLNTFKVSPKQTSALQARFKRNNATAVWVYAPGYIGEKKLSLEAMQGLTGIHLAESDSPGELHVDITNADHPYTRTLAKGFAYGTDVNVESIKATFDHRLYLKDPSDPSLQRDLPGFRITPRFYADDQQAIELGKLAGLNKAGLVVKKQPGWTSVYSSAPILPAALLRNIARAAGCHIFSDGDDVVYANNDFLCIYSPRGGDRTIQLRNAQTVTDAFDGQPISAGKKSFSIPIQANSARLFLLR